MRYGGKSWSKFAREHPDRLTDIDKVRKEYEAYQEDIKNAR